MLRLPAPSRPERPERLPHYVANNVITTKGLGALGRICWLPCGYTDSHIVCRGPLPMPAAVEFQWGSSLASGVRSW
jgi:hypothetical protein